MPQADEQTIRNILNYQTEMNTRIYNYPTSAIKINDKKISYYNFLTNTEDPDCLKSLIHIYNCIDFKKINTFIDNIECLDNIQKEFYKCFLKERFNRILTPAYKRAIEYVKDNEEKENGREQDHQEQLLERDEEYEECDEFER